LYSQGRGGLQKDYAEAVRWYKKVLYEHSALPKSDTAYAYVEIGELYRIGGNGINKDLVKAYACYRIAMILNTKSKGKLFPNPEPHIKSLKGKLTRGELAIVERMINEEIKGKHKIIPRE
jgi:hypothetical protein